MKLKLYQTEAFDLWSKLIMLRSMLDKTMSELDYTIKKIENKIF